MHRAAKAELPEPFVRELEDAGLNLFGVLGGDAYDALCPTPFRRSATCADAQSAIVIGSGGRALWNAIQRASEAGQRHQIDAFTQRIITAAVRTHLTPAFGESHCLWPGAVREETFLPMQALAMAAGLGVPSRMMLFIHPTYGMWMGLRGVILTPAEFPPTPSLQSEGFDPCATCHAPCARVCHGRVITDAGYDSAGCVRTRILNSSCRRTCDARLACPLGVAHQYAPDQMAHHSRHLLSPKTLGRFALFVARQRFRTRARAS